MADIHPSSVIDSRAELADDVEVGPLCYVGPNVRIGHGTRLISHVSILGPTTIGQGNTLWPQCVLGADPQDLKYHGEHTELRIGDHNIIREAVTIHRGTVNDQCVTVVGDHNLIMAYTHIAHDCIIDNHIVLANSIALAGHIHIQDHAVLGGQTAIHHFVTVGQYSYIGGMTRLVHDVPPYMIVEGYRATVRSVNLVGLARHGFSDSSIQHLKTAWKKLFKNTAEGSGVGQTAQQLTQLEADYPDDQAVMTLITAIRNAQSGTHGRYREAMRQDNRRTAIPR